jgi:hypothetical protein
MRRGLSRGVWHLNHFESVFRRAAIRTYPIVGDIRPSSARGNSVFRQTQTLVVQKATSVAHEPLEAFVIHTSLPDDRAGSNSSA